MTAAAVLAAGLTLWQGYDTYVSTLNPNGISGALQMGALTAAVAFPFALMVATAGFGTGWRRGLRLAVGYSAWGLMVVMPPLVIDMVGDGVWNGGALLGGCLVGALPTLLLFVLGALCINPALLDATAAASSPSATAVRNGDELLITVKLR